MLLFIPYGVDNPMQRLPLVNWALLVANVAVFVLQSACGTVIQVHGMRPVAIDRLVADYGLVPGALRWYQPLTSMFLHGDVVHLLGNLIFLWAFGNNVNDRLGHLRYLAAYLGFGVVAALGHVLAHFGSQVPCIGASGAIFGVMGMYLAFFPVNDVRVFWLFFIRFGTFSCSTIWPVSFYVALNLYYVATGAGGNLAVSAHLAGFAAGFGAGIVMLAKGFAERDDYDFLSWLAGRRQRRLRERYAVGAAAEPRFAPLPTPPAAAAAAAAPRELRQEPSARELQKALRDHLAAGDVVAVHETYQQFVRLYPRLPLGEALQIDVANLLFRASREAAAAQAYERFARFYPRHPQAPDALYSAGILCTRRLKQAGKGRRLLEEAAPLLSDAAKARRARAAIVEIERAARTRRVHLSDEES